MERETNQRILDHILTGQVLLGMSFYGVVWISGQRGSKKETYLTIGTKKVGFSRPENLPEHLDTPLIQDEQLVLGLYRLRDKKIVRATLGNEAPHLSIQFEGNESLFINGHDLQYEPWELSAGEYRIVAGPNDKLITWIPKEFATR